MTFCINYIIEVSIYQGFITIERIDKIKCFIGMGFDVKPCYYLKVFMLLTFLMIFGGVFGQP